MSPITFDPRAHAARTNRGLRAIARRAAQPVARSEWSLFLPAFAGALVFILALGVM